MGIYIQYILHSLVLIFDPKCGCGGGGGGIKKCMLLVFPKMFIFGNIEICIFFVEKSISHFMFSLRFMLFSTFLENKIFQGVGGVNKYWWSSLASEPVGGRSRATELPCFDLNPFIWFFVCKQHSTATNIQSLLNTCFNIFINLAHWTADH